MKACEFWHYLQVFNWIIIGYRAYKRWQGGSITQFATQKCFTAFQNQITQSRSVDPSLVVYEYVWGLYIYIWYI